MTRKTLAFGAALVVLASTMVVMEFPSRTSRAAAEPMAELEEEDAGRVAWCAEGLVPIHGEGCFARPAGGAKDAPLIVYLHGIYDKNADADEPDRQRRVGLIAVRHGFAVLALRGVEGGCSTEPDLATKFCWPSNERTAARGPETVNEWKPALQAATDRGAGGTRYVLGFSNGGFFAGLLAVPPLLLMSADEDPSQDGMLRLDEELSREGWAHENYSRAGTHELADDEIEAAVTFFVRLRDEQLPLSPPLSTHRPRAR